MTIATHPTPRRSKLSLYLDLIRWDRPIGWLLLLWPSLAALWLAAGGFPGWHLVAVFVLGTILMRSAGCCVNDVADREFDRHVKRTTARPVTTGEIGVAEALTVGAVLALTAFALVLTTTPAAVFWAFPGLAVAIVYPYSKRWFSMPQAVLGVAFSFGIPIAFAAVQNQVPWQAWALLAGNLFWVLCYDTEYAMVDRDDDLKIGIKTAAITLGRWDVAAILAFYTIYLGIWFAVSVPIAGSSFLYAAFALAVAQVVWHYRLIRDRTRAGCFRAFNKNHWLSFTLFAGIVLSFALGAPR